MPNPLRSSMADLITHVRLMISDPSGASQQFTDSQIQDELDSTVEVIRYLPLTIAPSIVNLASTNNIPSTIFADYYSEGYTFWEPDSIIQGQNTSTGAAWIVLNPTTADWLTGHFTFESNVFTSGTVPGQWPPVFITGKCYGVYEAAANLLEFWAATYARRFSFTSDSQSFQITQARDGLLQQAMYYRRRSKPRIATVTRSDVNPPLSAHEVHLLDSGDVFKGV